MRSQNFSETRQGLFNIAGTNMKKAERSPKTVKACLRKFQMPHIHFFHLRRLDTLFGEAYETLGQIDGCDVVAQPGKSFGIHSRATATVEDFRSNWQLLNEMLSFWFDELVGRFEVVTVVFRSLIVGLFDMRIVRVFRFHGRRLSQQ